MVDGEQSGLSNVTFEHHATIYMGGKTAELYQWGRAQTNGDAVVLCSAQRERVLASGDMFTYGDDVPELIDYSGGGSGKEWTTTLDSALKLDFRPRRSRPWQCHHQGGDAKIPLEHLELRQSRA